MLISALNFPSRRAQRRSQALTIRTSMYMSRTLQWRPALTRAQSAVLLRTPINEPWHPRGGRVPPNTRGSHTRSRLIAIVRAESRFVVRRSRGRSAWDLFIEIFHVSSCRRSRGSHCCPSIQRIRVCISSRSLRKLWLPHPLHQRGFKGILFGSETISIAARSITRN